MDPARYNALLAGVTPSSVILRDAFVHSFSVGFSAELASAPTIIADSDWVIKEHGVATLKHDYQASFASAKDSSELLLVRATYELEIRSSEQIDEEFLAEYASRQLVLYTRPYFRELLASVASRTNIITVPIATQFIPAKPSEPELPQVALPEPGNSNLGGPNGSH